MSKTVESGNSGIRVNEMVNVADLYNKLKSEIENNIYILFSEAEAEVPASQVRLSQARIPSRTLSRNLASDLSESFSSSMSLSQQAEMILLDFINYLPKRSDIDIIIFRLPFETKVDWTHDLWKDIKIRLEVLPTLMRWDGPQRLTGSECSRYPLLRLLFEEDSKRPWVDPSWNPRVKEKPPE